ncbi:sulfite exporter TauE/SafE family protein [Pelagibacterium sp.]|uniref:sulfite exporter TauE/SafE family protein n=1 Tax=Pelagibacterium sp. TaxID=1967288 RepID=UPI003BA9DB08
MSDLITQFLPFAFGLALTGAVSGVMAGLLGIGGGIIMVPSMVFAYQLLGYNPDVIMHVAVGTSLAVIIPTGMRSARSHGKRGAVDGGIVRLWAPWIVAASLLGGLMAGLYSAAALKIIFGVMALFIALNMALPVQRRLMETLAGVPMVNRISAAVIGYISALMGVGGGSLTVPTLTAFGTPIHTAVGTSSTLGVILAVPAVVGFVISGWNATGTPPLSIGLSTSPHSF